MTHRTTSHVRRFSEINRLDYTTALGEFDLDTGEALYAIPDRPEGRDLTAERDWARRRGLVRGVRSRCFHALVEQEHSSRSCPPHHPCSPRGPERFKQNGRAYHLRNGRRRARVAALTFAPEAHWHDDDLLAELEANASRFQLRYRIGLSADITFGAGTMPVVFWNPRLIDLI